MKKLIFFLIVTCISFKCFALEIKSDVFDNKGYIPDRYTCDSRDISPALIFSDIPNGAQSLALICDDPDASFKIWVHWILFNIPTSLTELKEDIMKEELSEFSIVEGANDFGYIGYKGPCPPEGKPHRYLFKLYALDTMLDLEEGISKKEIVEAMQGHILAEAKVIGFYEKAQEKTTEDENGED